MQYFISWIFFPLDYPIQLLLVKLSSTHYIFSTCTHLGTFCFHLLQPHMHLTGQLQDPRPSDGGSEEAEVQVSALVRPVSIPLGRGPELDFSVLANAS